MEIRAYLSAKKALIDTELEAILSGEDIPVETLATGVRQAVFPGGKRIRPILTLAGCEAVGGECPQVARIACSVELVHCYSLVHDDLPAMDDSDLRRGLPTVHKVVGEGMAVLAGDFLFTLAFQTLVNLEGVNDSRRTRLMRELVAACGMLGLAGGQALDLDSEQRKVTQQTVQDIAKRKTGALITASVVMGGIAGDSSDESLGKLKEYGKSVGLAFQIMDDILDAEGNQEALGKPVRADEERGKAAYPSRLGTTASRQFAEELTQRALASLQEFGERAEPLREIAKLLLRRKG
jgi:geranylgeranyl diphosphate synthase type II